LGTVTFAAAKRRQSIGPTMRKPDWQTRNCHNTAFHPTWSGQW